MAQVRNLSPIEVVLCWHLMSDELTLFYLPVSCQV